MQLDEALNFTKKLAEDVGKIQKEKFRENFKVRTKSTDSDLVTEVDYLCEKIIRKRIEEKFPEHNILGEEEGKAEKNSDYTWIVDPLDGSNNYAIGYPIYSVSIALQFKNKIILGVIYLSERDELYYAVKDKGAFLGNKKLKISEENSLSNSTLVTGFPYDKAISHIDNLLPFKKIVKKARGIRRSGSAAFDLVCVAAGILEAVWEFKLSEWDTAAGKILIKEAGGTVFETEINNSPLIIAGSEKIVEEIKSIILKTYRK
ncbi:MAG: inositol monophosphatase family protein [bacterium]